MTEELNETVVADLELQPVNNDVEVVENVVASEQAIAPPAPKTTKRAQKNTGMEELAATVAAQQKQIQALLEAQNKQPEPVAEVKEEPKAVGLGQAQGQGIPFAGTHYRPAPEGAKMSLMQRLHWIARALPQTVHSVGGIR